MWQSELELLKALPIHAICLFPQRALPLPGVPYAQMFPPFQMCSRSLFDRSLERPRVDADVLLRSKMVLPLRRFGIRGTLWQRDRLDWLSGFGWHASRQHRTLL